MKKNFGHVVALFFAFCRFFGCKNRARCSEMLKICEMKAGSVLEAWAKNGLVQRGARKVMAKKLRVSGSFSVIFMGRKNENFQNF